ncbi:hypothetical protein RclHR1_00070016 [Rhizophagus clarus]|uniref:Alcohol acetyltransferase n=1 Tax=Rhizophagus clarus TaxID=94130 RepID=A0A2Z6SK89_9GLOM|nr:hypothetical protein RclHR1_00070016 [Rhizophagus clarus]
MKPKMSLQEFFIRHLKNILKESSLAVSFADLHTSKPLFIRLSEIDLNKIVRFTIVNDDDDMKQMLEKEHVKKFNVEYNSVPLWRIIVEIKRTSSVEEESRNWNLVISIVYHHSIGDGKSGLVFCSSFHESLLEILSENDFKQESYNELKSKITLPQQSTKPFCKPIEECVDIKLPAIEESILSNFIKKKLLKGYWLGDVPAFSFPKNTTRITYIFYLS